MPDARLQRTRDADDTNGLSRGYWDRIMASLDDLPSIAQRYKVMTDDDGVTMRVPLPARFEPR